MLQLTLSKYRVISVGVIVLILAGCSATKLPPVQAKKSALTLSDSLLNANKGTVDGLYTSWIKPFHTHPEYYVPHEDAAQRSSSEAAVKDGFKRFCEVSGGVLVHKKKEFGDSYRCSASDSTFIGEFTTSRFQGNLLLIEYNSPKLIQGRELKQKEYEARKAQNGPTGWIETNEGKLNFLRIGNLKERHVLEIGLSNPNENVPIEQIDRIDFSEKCCDIHVTLKSGRRETVNIVNVTNYSLHSRSTYGVGRYGLPFVVVDPESGQPYVRIFSNMEGIKSIQIEKNEAIWRNKPITEINTLFGQNLQTRLDKYVQNLRVEAHQLYTEASKKGWTKLLPDGKLTPQLMSYLQSELSIISDDSDCLNDVSSGIISPETSLRCLRAKHELNLIVKEGYSLVTDITPLSCIIVLNKIKRDVR